MIAAQHDNGSAFGAAALAEAQKLTALKQVYRKAVKDKPRNRVRWSKDLPALKQCEP